MVLLPDEISLEDEGWRNACALMRVIPLDPRRGGGAGYKLDARDYLVRSKVKMASGWVDGPNYSFALRFAVSATVIGVIPVSDQKSIDEFCRVVNEAIESPLCRAELRRWQEYELKNSWQTAAARAHGRSAPSPRLPDEPIDSHVLYKNAIESVKGSIDHQAGAHQVAMKTLIRQGLSMDCPYTEAPAAQKYAMRQCA